MPRAMRFRVEGRGDPLVLLPGAACAPSLWEEATRRLEGRFALHLASIAGFAGAPPAPLPLFEKCLSDGLEELETIAAAGAPAIVVGHSFGGALALELALRFPRLVRGLVMVESAPALGPVMYQTDDPEEHARRAEEQHALARDPDAYVAFLVSSLRRMFHRPSHFEAVAKAAGLSDPDVVADALAYVSTHDARPRLCELEAPTQLVLGAWPDVDASSRNRAIREQLSTCPELTVTVIPASAHFPMLEAPDDFAAALIEFIESIEGAP